MDVNYLNGCTTTGTKKKRKEKKKEKELAYYC